MLSLVPFVFVITLKNIIFNLEHFVVVPTANLKQLLDQIIRLCNIQDFLIQLLDTVREGVITYASANTRELFYSPATPPPPPPPIQEDISSAAEFHASKTQVSI